MSLRVFRDTSHGGFFWSLTRDLKPHSPRKQIYAEAFTIYGLTEWHLATGDQAACSVQLSAAPSTGSHAFCAMLPKPTTPMRNLVPTF